MKSYLYFSTSSSCGVASDLNIMTAMHSLRPFARAEYISDKDFPAATGVGAFWICLQTSSAGTVLEKALSPKTRNLSWGLRTSSRTSGSGKDDHSPLGEALFGDEPKLLLQHTSEACER